MRLQTISRKLRQRFYYSVPAAGAQIGLGRSQSYLAAESGEIPAERYGKLLLVPRRHWDREVKRLLRGLAPRRGFAKTGGGRPRKAQATQQQPATT